MILIDNEKFDVGITKITSKASQLAESLGTTMDGTKHYDVKGTYYDYDVVFNYIVKKAWNLRENIVKYNVDKF